MLHIVNKSHLQTRSLESCLRMVRDGDALLLIEDAIYAGTARGAASAGLAAAMKRVKVFALQPDMDARGMGGALADGVTAVDYGGFVDLVAEHSNSQSWL